MVLSDIMVSKKKMFDKNMRIVFDRALKKAKSRASKPYNAVEPYDHFSYEHLKKRLKEEYLEYIESESQHELLDIINIAAFLYVNRMKEIDETINNSMNRRY